jgi:1,6-anhydro-N-acetylmuramate kinase
VFIATLFAHDLIRKPVLTFRDHAPCYAGGGAGCVTGPALYAKALDAKVLGLAEALVDRLPGSVMPEQIASELPAGAVADGAATLTALTAAAVARIVAHLSRAPASWIVAGGGARNPTLMRMLAERLAPASVESAHAVGWSIDSLEAQAFAYLAVRSLRGLPLTFLGTTGAPHPLTGGELAKP